MLKTTKEFDFVYKNSYKFRAETLDICVLKPNLVAQFCAKFGRISSDFVGFSVSKKVGIAVERNLIKRRLRTICREFFVANSPCSDFLGCASAHSLQRTASASHSFALHNPKNSSTMLEFADLNESSLRTNLTQDTRIANDLKNESSLRGESIDSPKQSTLCRHTERSEVSKSRESKRQGKSRAEKRIDELDSPLQNCDSSKLDSRVLDSSLRTSASLRMTESGADSRNDKNRTNLICIFIAKNGILQMPFGALKESIFATLKRQINFRNDSHKNKRGFANHTNPKSANRAHTKALQQ